MTPKHPRRPAGGPGAEASAQPPRKPGNSAGSWWLRLLRGQILGRALSPIGGLMLSIPLFFACLFLVLAWKIGPQRLIDAARLRKLTAHTEGRILESWLALDFNPADMVKHHYWRQLSRVSLCAVVEYDPGWTNGPIRKAFCGPRWTRNDSFKLEDFRSLSPHVPLVWSRDANGFAVPEIRMSTAARDWLATHPEPDPLPNDPPTRTALESMRLDVDQPIAFAIAGWTSPAAAIPLAFDPHDPQGAIPAGFIAQVLDQPPTLITLVAFAILFVPGVLVWTVAMSLMLGPVSRFGFWFLTLVPLLALPWWGDSMPRYIGRLNWRAGEIVTSFLDDLERLGHMDSSTPDLATLAHGERLVWNLKDSLYVGTFGRLHFAPPNAPLKSKEEAMRVLVDGVTAQVRALDPSEQTALFARLRQEKEHKLTGAGFVFMDAAGKVVADTEASPELRRSANSFLEAWGHYFNYPAPAKGPAGGGR